MRKLELHEFIQRNAEYHGETPPMLKHIVHSASVNGNCFWCGCTTYRTFNHQQDRGTREHLVPAYMGRKAGSPSVHSCARCNHGWAGKFYPVCSRTMAEFLLTRRCTKDIRTALWIAQKARSCAVLQYARMYWDAVVEILEKSEGS